MFNGNKHTLYNFKSCIWVKAIAVVIIVTFLCRDIAWANPDLKISSTPTLAAQSFFARETSPESFQRVISAYLNTDLFSRTEGKSATPPTVSTIERIVRDLVDRAQKNGLDRKELPEVTGDGTQGAVKITFPDGRALLFFNPEVREGATENEWRTFFNPYDEKVVKDLAVGKYLREQILEKGADTTRALAEEISKLDGTEITDATGETHVLEYGRVEHFRYPHEIKIVRKSDRTQVGIVPYSIRSSEENDNIIELGFCRIFDNVVGENGEKIDYRGRGIFPLAIEHISSKMPEGAGLFSAEIVEEKTLKQLASGKDWENTRMGSILKGAGWKTDLVYIFDRDKTTCVLEDSSDKWPDLYDPDGFRETIAVAIEKSGGAENITGITLSISLTKGAPKKAQKGRILTSYEAEAVYKDYFEALFELNLKLFVLMSKRMKYRKLEDELFLASVKDETDECLSDIHEKIRDFETRMAELPRNVQMKSAHELAKEGLVKAEDLISKNNEPAASAALVGSLNRISEAREKALIKRVSGRRKKIRVKRSGSKIIMQQQRYVKTHKKADTLMPVYTDIVFDLRWQAGRSLDEQEDSILNEREWLVSALEDIRHGQDIAERGASWGIGQKTDAILTALERVDVEEKRLARIVMRTVKELVELDDAAIIKNVLPIAGRYLQIRLDDLNSMMGYIKTGRTEPFRRIVKRDNDEFMARVDKALSFMRSGNYKRAQGNTYGLWHKIKKYLKEPDLEDVGSVIWPAISEMDKLKDVERSDTDELFEIQEEQEAKRRAEFWLTLVRKKIEDSRNLSEFMERFRTEYTSKKLRDRSKYLKQDTFVSVFENFADRKNLVRGSPEERSFKMLCYLAAFVPMKVKNPEKPSEKIDNPLFAPINAFRLMVGVDEISKLLKVRRLSSLNSTREALQILSRKRYVHELDRNEKTGLLKAISRDFSLTEEQRFELAKAAAITRSNLRKIYQAPTNDTKDSAPLGFLSWIWNPLIGRGFISIETAARISFIAEEGIFAGIFLNFLPWFNAVTGFLLTSNTTALYLLSITAFSLSHDILYRWKNENSSRINSFGLPYIDSVQKIKAAGRADWKDHLGFAVLGAIFRSAYLIPGISPVYSLAVAMALHAVYNNFIAEKVNLPVGMTVRQGKEGQSGEDKKIKGAAAEPLKLEAGALMGVAATAALLPLWLVYYKSTFALILGLSYILSVSIVPIMTAYHITDVLSFRHQRKDYGLIRPFEKAENIRYIEKVIDEDDAKGKISYYSYTIEDQLKNGGEHVLKSALFAHKTALRHMPKFFQWVIYFHEAIHYRLRVKVEAAAVPLTFGLPWAAGCSVLMLTGGWFLPWKDSLLTSMIIVYNLIIPIISALVVNMTGLLKKSPGGHYVSDRKVRQHLTPAEVDNYIADHAHDQTYNEETGNMVYWRNWLSGGSGRDNVELIECPGRVEDIIVVKASYKPSRLPDQKLFRKKISSSDKRSFVLIIADDGQETIETKRAKNNGVKNKKTSTKKVRRILERGADARKRRITKIASDADKMLKSMQEKDRLGFTSARRFIKKEVRSTKYDIRILRDLLGFYRRRLSRIKHGDISREVVVCETHGHTHRLKILLKWLKDNRYKSAVFLGDYLGKWGGGLEAMDMLRRHMKKGDAPRVTLIMGNSEHVFMRALLGDDRWSDSWPSNCVLEGPEVMKSLHRLAKGEVEGEITPEIQKEIDDARDFEDRVRRIAQRNGTEFEQEWDNWYRMHPQLIKTADFITENMKFVYHEDSHHNIYKLGNIPDDFTRHGLQGIEALEEMEEEFRQGTESGLRLLKLMREIWMRLYEDPQADPDEEAAERNRVLDIILAEKDVISLAGREESGHKDPRRVLIQRYILDTMELLIREEPEREHRDRIFNDLSEKLSDITRPLPEVFNKVFDVVEGQFMVQADAMFRKRDEEPEGVRQARRIELGVNTIITTNNFPDDIGFQSLRYARAMDRSGAMKMIDVDSLEGDGRVRGDVVLVARTDQESLYIANGMFLEEMRSDTPEEKWGSAAGRSLESITRRKLEGVEKIIDDIDFIASDIEEGPVKHFWSRMRYIAGTPLFKRTASILIFAAVATYSYFSRDEAGPALAGIMYMGAIFEDRDDYKKKIETELGDLEEELSDIILEFSSLTDLDEGENKTDLLNKQSSVRKRAVELLRDANLFLENLEDPELADNDDIDEDVLAVVEKVHAEILEESGERLEELISGTESLVGEISEEIGDEGSGEDEKGEDEEVPAGYGNVTAEGLEGELKKAEEITSAGKLRERIHDLRRTFIELVQHHPKEKYPDLYGEGRFGRIAGMFKALRDRVESLGSGDGKVGGSIIEAVLLASVTAMIVSLFAPIAFKYKFILDFEVKYLFMVYGGYVAGVMTVGLLQKIENMIKERREKLEWSKPLKAKRLLILDDRPDHIRQVKEVYAGCPVIMEAKSLEEAKEIIENNEPFDLVISDLCLYGTPLGSLRSVKFNGKKVQLRKAGEAFVLWLKDHEKSPKTILLHSTTFDTMSMDAMFNSLTGYVPSVVRERVSKAGILVRPKSVIIKPHPHKAKTLFMWAGIMSVAFSLDLFVIAKYLDMSVAGISAVGFTAVVTGLIIKAIMAKNADKRQEAKGVESGTMEKENLIPEKTEEKKTPYVEEKKKAPPVVLPKKSITEEALPLIEDVSHGDYIQKPQELKDLGYETFLFFAGKGGARGPAQEIITYARNIGFSDIEAAELCSTMAFLAGKFNHEVPNEVEMILFSRIDKDGLKGIEVIVRGYSEGVSDIKMFTEAGFENIVVEEEGKKTVHRGDGTVEESKGDIDHGVRVIARRYLPEKKEQEPASLAEKDKTEEPDSRGVGEDVASRQGDGESALAVEEKVSGIDQQQSEIINFNEIEKAIDEINGSFFGNIFDSFARRNLAIKIHSMGLERGKKFLVVGPGHADGFPVLLAKLGLRVTVVDTDKSAVSTQADIHKIFGLDRQIEVFSSYGDIEENSFDYVSIFAVLDNVLNPTKDPTLRSLVKADMRGGTIRDKAIIENIAKMVSERKVKDFVSPILERLNPDGAYVFVNCPSAASVEQCRQDVLSVPFHGKHLYYLDNALTELGDTLGLDFDIEDGIDVDDIGINLFVPRAEARKGIVYRTRDRKRAGFAARQGDGEEDPSLSPDELLERLVEEDRLVDARSEMKRFGYDVFTFWPGMSDVNTRTIMMAIDSFMKRYKLDEAELQGVRDAVMTMMDGFAYADPLEPAILMFRDYPAEGQYLEFIFRGFGKKADEITVDAEKFLVVAVDSYGENITYTPGKAVKHDRSPVTIGTRIIAHWTMPVPSEAVAGDPTSAADPSKEEKITDFPVGKIQVEAPGKYKNKELCMLPHPDGYIAVATTPVFVEKVMAGAREYAGEEKSLANKKRQDFLRVIGSHSAMSRADDKVKVPKVIHQAMLEQGFWENDPDNFIVEEREENLRIWPADEYLVDNAKKVVSFLANALMSWSGQSPDEKYVLAIDPGKASKSEVSAMIKDCVIDPLKKMNGNNSELEIILKNLHIIVDEGENLSRRLDAMTSRGKNRIKKENIVIVSPKSDMGHFDAFKDVSFLTGFDDSQLKTKGKKVDYYPVVEIALFAVLRAIRAGDVKGGVKSDQLLRWYRHIPNARKLNEDDFIAMCFDEAGNSRNTIVIDLIPKAARFDHSKLNEIYETIRTFIESA